MSANKTSARVFRRVLVSSHTCTTNMAPILSQSIETWLVSTMRRAICKASICMLRNSAIPLGPVISIVICFSLSFPDL